MKVTYNWLKEFVDFDLSPEELAEVLTMLGLEVDGMEKQGAGMDDILVHDETNRVLGGLLADLEAPFPVALGVIYCDPAESYEVSAWAQMDQAKAKNPKPDINTLLRSGNVWTVA